MNSVRVPTSVGWWLFEFSAELCGFLRDSLRFTWLALTGEDAEVFPEVYGEILSF